MKLALNSIYLIKSTGSSPTIEDDSTRCPTQDVAQKSKKKSIEPCVEIEPDCDDSYKDRLEKESDDDFYEQ